MNRFRKKSDAKRGQLPSSASNAPTLDALPPLPAVNDFRTSLILPTLGRRFSLLRSQQGDHSVDALRSKLEEQRARGAANHITEEEEDIMIAALNGIARSSTASNDVPVDEDELDLAYYASAAGRASNVPSTPSSSTTAYPRSSVTASEASPGSTRISKRNSSNLFGSGRFRDQSYIRAARDRNVSFTSSSASLSPGTPRGRYTSLNSSSQSVTRENSSSTLASSHDRDSTEASSSGFSVKDSDRTPTAKPLNLSSSPLAPVSSLETVSETSYLGTLTTLSPERQKRISLAFETALQDLTGVDMPPEGEDLVLTPRSARPPSSRTSPRWGNGSAPLPQDLFAAASAQQFSAESGAPQFATSDDVDAFMDDDPFASQPMVSAKNGSNSSPTPSQRTPVSPAATFPPRATSPRVPGYIPGMQRPTSPRDVERSDSTTPRATVPPTHSTFRHPREQGRAPFSPPQIPASILSPARTALPRSDSPAPGLHQHSHSKSSSFGSFAEMTRFRHESPAPEQQFYQPQPVSILKSSGRPMSPPTNRTPTPGQDGSAWYYSRHVNRGATPDFSREGHSRHGSVLSDETDPYGTARGSGPGHARAKSGGSIRSLSSPALPDSPLLEATQYGSISNAWDLDNEIQRPATPRSPPFLARSPSLTRRAPDVEHIGPRFTTTPPPAPSAGRPRTPSRAVHSPSSSASSFNNPVNPLVLSPFNASAASVASAGSSYHSEPEDESEERLFALLHAGTKKRKWDDFAGEFAGAATVIVQLPGQDDDSERPVEDVVTSLTGLSKEDVVTIQRKLLEAALQIKSTVEPPASRPPSLRRRRGSIGQTMGGPQSPSRTTSPGPISPHVSPKSSLSPFSSTATQPLSAAPSSTSSLTTSVAPSSSSSSTSSISVSSPLSPIPPSSPPYSTANLTGSDTEREKTPAPRSSDRGARTNALLTSMMESIDKPAKARTTPPASSTPITGSTTASPPASVPASIPTSAPAPVQSTIPVLTSAPTPAPAPASAPVLPNYARPLSPQLQSPRAISPVRTAAASSSPTRARSPPILIPKAPPPHDPGTRAKSPVQQFQQQQQPSSTTAHHNPTSSQSSDLSSILRNKALADALFGSDNDHPVSAAQALSSEPSPQSSQDEDIDHREPSPTLGPRVLHDQASASHTHQRYGSPPPGSRRYGSPSPGPYDYSPSPEYYSPSPNKQGYGSSAHLPPDDAQLEQDVRRKVEQATAALKSSPSHTSLRDRSGSLRRRKIDLNTISGPQLMSSSTSLEAVPPIPASRSQVTLNSPSESRSTGSKFTQRFKKFGGWRSKPSTPNADEPPPFGRGVSPNSASPTSSWNQHSVHVNPLSTSNLNGPVSASAVDNSHFRFPPASPAYSPQTPPASAGPAFKSFMSKFKPFSGSSTDLTAQRGERERDRLPPSSTGFSSHRSPNVLTPTIGAGRGRLESRHAYPGAMPSSPLSSDTFPRSRTSLDDSPAARKSPELALKQIFDGAAQAGLNATQMEELTAFLSRSLSTSSRATAAPTTQSPAPTRPLAEPSSPLPPDRKSISRAARKSTAPSTRPGRDEDTRSIVVRRTIYMTSDKRPLVPTESLSRRPSHRKQGSETAISIRSGKSVQDRIGTPPPRAAQKRFSSDAPPPVPTLSGNYLDAPGMAAAANSTSSLVDMYGDSVSIPPSERDRYSSRSPFPSSVSQRNAQSNDQAQALEVLEFADGRVVWQIVDGLRATEDFDYEDEPGFRSRASFDSGYSVPEREAELQLQLREHKRVPSKSSATSSNFNRKSAYNRPETQVFFSDAEHIGRLIDSMTRGMQSGSFNVVPNMPTPTGPSFPDAQPGWTMEEHLDHVLGSLSPTTSSP